MMRIWASLCYYYEMKLSNIDSYVYLTFDRYTHIPAYRTRIVIVKLSNIDQPKT